MPTSRLITANAVLFDMDGTLVDSTAVVEQIWAEFAEWFDLGLDEILSYSHGRLTIDTVRKFAPTTVDPVEVTQRLEALELEDTDGIIEVPGAKQLLTPLVEAGLAAVVTSAPRDLAIARMRACDLPVPEVLVSAEDVSNGKPNPEGYLKAAAELHVDPVNAVVFEDAEAGVKAGLAAQSQVIVVGSLDSPLIDELPRAADLNAVTLEIAAESGEPKEVRLTL